MENEAGSSGTLQSQFQLLRARIESEIHKPAVIVVTSAESGDGKSLTAFALADCLAKAGHRSAVVDASGNRREQTQEPAGPFEEKPMLSLVAFPGSPSDAVSRETCEAFAAEARATYDYTVVDTCALLTSTLAMSLAGSSDAILIAVRIGRAPTRNDQFTVQMLEHAKAHVVGVVATAQDAIVDFDKRRDAGTLLKSFKKREFSHEVPWVQPARTLIAAAALFALMTTGSFLTLRNIPGESGSPPSLVTSVATRSSVAPAVAMNFVKETVSLIGTAFASQPSGARPHVRGAAIPAAAAE